MMTNHFATVVEINAEVQAVVAETRRLYLVSLNAMFLAKRSGHGASAFQRVTGELRRFSDCMQRQMDQVRVSIFELVQRVSELRRLERTLGLTRQAAELAAAGGWHGSMGQGPLLRARLAREIEVCRHHFERAVAAAERLCVIGENLAVLAKVEAASTRGESACRLVQVAEELAAVVERIRVPLARSTRRAESIEEMAA